MHDSSSSRRHTGRNDQGDIGGKLLWARPEAEGKEGTLGRRPDAAERRGRKRDVRTWDKKGEKRRRCGVAAGGG